jgi:DNA transposition AAA+ family ATPase
MSELPVPLPPNDITPADKAQAASAHSRINIPLNLENWRHLDEKLQGNLLWFHQHALDTHMGFKECGRALGYDASTIFKMLHGNYAGSWENINASIQSYRRVVEERGTIQQNVFAENSVSRLIWAGLSYALAANSITLISGDSRSGKTISTEAWRAANNHGRAVMTIAPAYGGTRALLRNISKVVGVNKNLSGESMYDAILRSFNANRMLIIDEAHRLLPSGRRTNPVSLEILRDIHDSTHCGLALIATERFDNELRKGEYMYEQLLGRFGMPVRLPRKLKRADFEPILHQYIVRPSEGVIEAAEQIANARGRLGILVELLKSASRIAAKEQKSVKPRIGEDHFFKACAFRRKMSVGENS